MASTYSTVTDLLLGDMPVALEVNKQKYVDDAADEIDSIIGKRYETPIDVTETSAVPRYARLFIKRAANHLATGRLILAVAAGGEDTQLHAYGWSLVRDSLAALEQIASGEYDIPGAEPIPLDDALQPTAPSIVNQDASSGVDAFYSNVMAYGGFPALPVITGPRWEPGTGV